MRLQALGVFVSLSLLVSGGSTSAQNTNDIFRLFGGMMQTAIIQATLDQWRKIPQSEVVCVDQELVQRGSSLQRAIQQGITPSDPRIAGARSACQTPVIQQTAQGPSFDCKKVKMPDERAICSDAELSRLDNLVVSGYNYLRSRYGAQFAEAIGKPLWRARQACGSNISCIKQKQIAAINEYKARGAPIDTPEQFTTPVTDKSIYVVDGISLGSRVAFNSQTYSEYQCSPSEQFPGLTWCQKRGLETDPRGRYMSTRSILHSEDGVALYINRYLEPAWFSGNEANDDINIRSKRYGAPSRVIPMPQRSSIPYGMIVTWGNVILEPLGSDDVIPLAAGRDIRVGLILDHIGNFQRSAQQGLPIYRLTGGAGYVWVASWNQDGVGTLRFLAIDASAITRQTTVATNRGEPTKESTSRVELVFPALSGRVVDQANILDGSLRTTLTQKLAELEAKSTNQLVVVTLVSLQGATIEDFGVQLSNYWKIGQRDKNNGILLIVAPNERKVRIEVDIGLENTLTNATAKTIIDDSILPHFRAGNIPSGVEHGVDDLIKVLTEALHPPPPSLPTISPADEAASIVASVRSTLSKISDRSASLRDTDNRKRVEEIAARLATANLETPLAELRVLKGEADEAARIFEQEDEFGRVSEIANKRVAEISAELDKITSDAPLIQNLKSAIKTLRDEQNGTSIGSLQSALRKLNKLFDENRSELKSLEFESP